ncbi:LuxR C-terminal-related transcriptional regulator [Streptomyces sp. NPDC089424]|uniref:LuxR C-terminal-related transcriptional regulator n=1 Tax=Streptomyces sp. NPDC089424 TaxID=3365917 RepID=UPI00380E828D
MTVRNDNEQEPTPARVDPAGVPYLRTRLTPPARPATFLCRERLTRSLDQALSVPLTMVNGAAGGGKSLLVADWAAGLRHPVAWLTCDAADRAPGVFWAYVLEALHGAGMPVTSEIGSPAAAGRVDGGLLARLAAGLAARDRPVVLVLDEYDRVTTPDVAQQLRFVLDHADHGLRLVLVTRAEPLLPLHRYRASGRMTEIRNADLAFTPEEAAQLLTLHGISLPASTVRALVRRTQGWAAGLRLCALAAGQSPDPQTYLKEFEAGRSTVADFLLAEVLDQQSAERQDLLLRAAVLDRFCPDLLNALTLRTDAEAHLAALHRENAFLQQLGHSWYCLHPLFAEILRAHLRERAPGLEPELRRRAARWLRGSGALPEALAQGAAAGDWEFTARALVDDLAIGQLFTGLRAQDLRVLFERMPPTTAGPAADLVRAALALARHDLRHALAALGRARADLARDPGSAAVRLSCALLEALAARLNGSPDEAEEAARAAEEAKADVPADLLDAHPEFTALLLTHLGCARLWGGRFDAARAALGVAAECPGGASTALPRLESLGHLALIDHLTGRPGLAERRARAAAAEAERHGLPQGAGSGIGRLVLAAVAVDRDELAPARALLKEVAEPPGSRDPVTAAGRIIAEGRLLLARGDARAALETAGRAVTAAVPSPWAQEQIALIVSAAHLAQNSPDSALKDLRNGPGHGAVSAVATARACLAAGRLDEARDLIDHLPGDDRPGPAVTVRATLLRAQAAHQAGDLATARRLVARALLDARRERLRRPFAEAGPWIRPLLRADPLRELTYGWLTDAPGSGGPATRPTAEEPTALVVEELSARERDVLRRLARMMSTEEIATDLQVSVNTVKTHLKSAYRKLGVNRRGEAVRRARALRLL